jgi:hypothetical protein
MYLKSTISLHFFGHCSQNVYQFYMNRTVKILPDRDFFSIGNKGFNKTKVNQFLKYSKTVVLSVIPNPSLDTPPPPLGQGYKFVRH